ncbi:MAG TPA: hypothetical protein VMR70_02210 [Flavisolibacter sp.]|nr:hypothetical protein [Flavisolibacter sp.]
MEIKVGYLIAYDYKYLKQSLPTVYAHADKITVALDKNRKTFAGETFTVDPSFFTWLKEFDTQRKISLYEDEFFVPGMTTQAIEIRVRNMLAQKMGEGGWHIQVDADEYFVDFKSLVLDLKEAEKKYKNQKVSIRVYWYTIFKITSEGYFLIDNTYEAFALATNYPIYEQGRYNHSIENVSLNHMVLHQSWGRSEEELSKKLRNWSHNADFDTAKYFEFWKSVSIANYNYIYDFHPFFRDYWRRLKFIQGKSIDDLIAQVPSRLPDTQRPVFHRLQRWLPPVIFTKLQKLN